MRRRTLFASAAGALASGVIDRAVPGLRPAGIVRAQTSVTVTAVSAPGLPAGLNFTTADHKAFEVGA